MVGLRDASAYSAAPPDVLVAYDSRMPVDALTLDFWNTMVVGHTGGSARQRQRLDHLHATVCRYTPGATEARVRTAYDHAAERFDASWRERHVTPTTSELVRYIWDELALEPAGDDHDATVCVFEEGLLHGPPDPADGLTDALAWAAEHFRLAIISDTMFSPGRVIRRLLEERGVLHYFDAFVFSDETGFSKPDRRAFEQAARTLGTDPQRLVHIGDLRRTDVTGARRAGSRALLYTGIHHDDHGPEPDAHLAHWRDLPDTLQPFLA